MKKNFAIQIGFSVLWLCSSILHGQNPSVNDPLLIETTTTFELTEDIIIASPGSPFIAGPLFGKTTVDKLIITSNKSSAIIVSSTGLWDLSSFNSTNKRIEFRGNARLIMQPGARLNGAQTTLVFAERSRIE